ncbi:hypothetical protein BD410DRAFT_781809 [Rickenella mellea]|uniref:F-box domain-containing protein n=1 Tax=Rickenella mellea TaxID=50990 RepID=A0A4Y7QJR1_9AGAM|nr:hypothetical protein BD410DRAFT_781809 [Rickenella mellea]
MQILYDLPTDVISIIWRELALRDIASLRKVCAKLNRSISGDKQLWAHILQRDVVDRDISLLPYRSEFASSDAACIEAWVRQALNLEASFQNAESLGATQRVGLGACITWVKLVRGRWVLVASSDTRHSCLMLWDSMPPTKSLQKCANISLPGPVLDGQVEDTGSKITIAVSVGSADPYIEIMTLSFQFGHHIISLGHIPGASKTRFLKGSVVGFAALSGDDTYPCISDWATEKLCFITQLAYWHNPSVRPIPNVKDCVYKTCWAMRDWNEHVIVIRDDDLQIYMMPDFSKRNEKLSYAHHVATIPLSLLDPIRPTRQALVIHPPIERVHDRLQPIRSNTTYIFVRFGGSVNGYALSRKDDSLGAAQFELGTPSFLRGSDDRQGAAHSIFVGSTCKCLVRLCSFAFKRLEESASPPRLHVTKILRKATRVDMVGLEADCSTLSFQDTVLIPPKGLPLTHFWPSFDFDDARGILLMGTSRGDLCVARFTDDVTLLNPGCIFDNIPDLDCASQTKESTIMPPMQMDLPVYYRYRQTLSSGVVPTQLVEETVQNWGTSISAHHTMNGWSNDWHSFTKLKDWLAPSLRWGRADPDHYHWEDVAVTAAQTYCAPFGDVIPVLFMSNDHDRVLFRVGNRPYMWTLPHEQDPPWIRAFLVDINTLLQDYAYVGPSVVVDDIMLDRHDWGMNIQRSVISSYDNLIEELAMREDHIDVDPNPEMWSNENWSAIEAIIYPAPPPFEFEMVEFDLPLE